MATTTKKATTKPKRATAKPKAKATSKSKTKLSLSQQANKILAEAEKKGLQQNFFFATTFKRRKSLRTKEL